MNLRKKCGRCSRIHGCRTKTCRQCLAKVRERHFAKGAARVERYRQDREVARAAGICVNCKKRDAEEGVLYCWPCKQRQMENTRIRRARYAAKGRCVQCGDKRAFMRRCCQRCLDAQAYHEMSHCPCGLEKHTRDKWCALCSTVVTGVHARVPKILGIMRREPWSDTYTLAERAKVTTRTVWRVVARLQEIAAVERRVDEDTGRAQWRLDVMTTERDR